MTAPTTAASPKSSDAPVGDVVESPTTTGPPISARDPNPILVTMASGCPQSVAGHPDFSTTAAQWIANPDSNGLADAFVPGRPDAALVCRYAALNVPTPLPDGTTMEPGDLDATTQLAATDAGALADTLNAITPWDFTAGCVPPAFNARYTAIVFAIAGRIDVNVWLKDWYECPEVSNGLRASGELVNGQGHDFITTLNQLSPPAPQRDFTTP